MAANVCCAWLEREEIWAWIHDASLAKKKIECVCGVGGDICINSMAVTELITITMFNLEAQS